MFVSHNRSKKDINASVFLAKNTLFLWMSPSLKTNHTLSELLFKGRRVEDQFWFVLPMPVPESPLLVSLISLLPKSQKKESVLEKNVSVNCERKSVPIPSEPLQMYTRRKKMAKNLPQHGQSSTLDMVELNRRSHNLILSSISVILMCQYPLERVLDLVLNTISPSLSLIID